MSMLILVIHSLLSSPFAARLMPKRTDSWYLAVNTKKKDFSLHIFALPNINAVYTMIQSTLLSALRAYRRITLSAVFSLA